jgi:hypothetical protein
LVQEPRTESTNRKYTDCKHSINKRTATILGDIVIEPVPANACPDHCVCTVTKEVYTGIEAPTMVCNNGTTSSAPNRDPKVETAPSETRRRLQDGAKRSAHPACSKSGDMYVIFHCDFDAKENIGGTSMATYYADKECTIPIQSFAPMAPQLGFCYERVDDGRVSYEVIETCRKFVTHNLSLDLGSAVVDASIARGVVAAFVGVIGYVLSNI